MNILYTCDNNYIWLMGISTISLFENNKSIADLHVYLLGENISNDNKERLQDIAAKYNRTITVIDIPAFNIAKSLVSERWPISAFTRLYAANLLPSDIHQILYLDCDTIVAGDISALDNYTFGSKIIYGVKDCISEGYKKNIGMNPECGYVNAGVLLMNLDAMKRIDINCDIDAFLNRYEKSISYADQDILNGLFSEYLGYLHPMFDVMSIVAKYSYREIYQLRKPNNFYSEAEIVEAHNDPKIIHYTTNLTIIRPWYSNSNHPFREVFLKYKRISCWRDVELSEYTFRTKDYKIIGTIEKLPKVIAYPLLGLIHSHLKPLVIEMRSNRNTK